MTIEELNTDALIASETPSPLCCSYSRMALSQASSEEMMGSFSSMRKMLVNIAVNLIRCLGSHSSQNSRQISRPLPMGAARSFSSALSLQDNAST